MTRAPVVRLPSAKRAVELKEWLANPKNFYSIASAFNSTSRFASLAEVPRSPNPARWCVHQSHALLCTLD